MKDVTEHMLRFKEAARHIWNTYLLAQSEPMSLAVQDSFEKIERELLRALVLLPFGLPDVADNYRHAPLPIALRARNGLTDVPVQFGSVDQHRNIQWSLPSTITGADIPQYFFVEFFDWNPYGYIDRGYIKAQAADGRFFLIEQTYCYFIIVD